MEKVSAGPTVRPCPTPRRGAIIASYQSCIQLQAVSCKRWSCSTCGPRNARKLRHRLEQVTPNRFLTLTYRMAEGEQQDEAASHIRAAWIHMRKRMCRKLGVKSFKYVLVIEWTKKGAPHIHAMLDCGFLSQRWLSRQWRELTGSRIVDIRRIRSQETAARYLTSYLTKEQHMPKGMHKYSASRGYLPKLPPREYGPDEEKPEYHYDPRGIRELEREFSLDGYDVARLTDDCLVIFEPAGGAKSKRGTNGPGRGG